MQTFIINYNILLLKWNIQYIFWIFKKFWFCQKHIRCPWMTPRACPSFILKLGGKCSKSLLRDCLCNMTLAWLKLVLSQMPRNTTASVKYVVEEEKEGERKKEKDRRIHRQKKAQIWHPAWSIESEMLILPKEMVRSIFKYVLEKQVLRCAVSIRNKLHVIETGQKQRPPLQSKWK